MVLDLGCMGETTTPPIVFLLKKGTTILKVFLVAKLLYNLKCPPVLVWGKRDFLGSYKRYDAETF